MDEAHPIIASGGLIIQMMPDATEEDIVKTERLIAALKPMSELIRTSESLSDIVLSLYDDVKILSEQPICL